MTRRRPHTLDQFFASRRTRVIAHRGFSAVAPENTLAAIERAIELGADMVEFDVLASRDCQLVVIHDPTLERTTDGHGLVAGHTLAELRLLDAGRWFDPVFAGERIPTLDEVLEHCAGRILVNVEIKAEAVTDQVEGGIADLVARRLIDHGLVAQSLVSSFDHRALRQLRSLAPEIARGALFDRKAHRGMPLPELLGAVDARSFHVDRRLLRAPMLDLCRRLGVAVAVYTVDRRRTMRSLIARGVRALFTNRPDLLLDELATAARGTGDISTL